MMIRNTVSRVMGALIVGAGVACEPSMDVGSDDVADAADRALPDLGTDSVVPDGGGDVPVAPECAPGDEHYMVACDNAQVAVIERPGDAPEVRVLSGRGIRSRCDRIDTIEILHRGGDLIARLDAHGVPVSSVADQFSSWAVGDGTPVATQICAGDGSRFDGVTLVIRGTTDGGTFEARCGYRDVGVGWPPAVVLTCHEGMLPSSTVGAAMYYDERSDLTSVQSTLAAPRSLQGISLSPQGRIIFGTFPEEPLIAPVDTDGWGLGIWAPVTVPGLDLELQSFNFGTRSDVLGPVLCPTFPDEPLAPALVIRFQGETVSGPFRTELYSHGCGRL